MSFQLATKITLFCGLFLIFNKIPALNEIQGIYVNTPKTQEQESLKESINRGEIVYNDFCIQCHLPNGKGVEGVFPPLANSDWLIKKRTESIHSVKFGLQGEITVNGIKYNNLMPPMGLLDREIADVMNYIMNSWGNTQDKIVTVEEVKAIEN